MWQHLIALSSKPFFGSTLAGVAWLLNWLAIIGPFITFIVIVIGLVSAIYSLIHHRNQVLEDERRKARHTIKPKK